MLSVLSSGVCTHSTDAQGQPTVRTLQGLAIGAEAAPGIERYAGIPFALPPFGKRRFARAELNTAAWPNGQLDARHFGAPCIQNPSGDPRPPIWPKWFPGPKDESPPPSENCLVRTVLKPLCLLPWRCFGCGLLSRAMSYSGSSSTSGDHDRAAPLKTNARQRPCQ